MREQLQQLIRNGRFDEAKHLIEQIDHHVFEELLVEIAFENGDESNYLFVVYLLQQHECATYHHLAYLLMAQPLCHIERSYFTAYKHAKRAVELTNEADAMLLVNILFLHGVPDQVVSDEEATDVALKILKIEPSNAIANQWLRDNKRRY